SVRGTVAVADALLAGATSLSPEGTFRVDAKIDGIAPRVSGFVTADVLRIEPSERAPIFAVTDASALFRLDARRFVWHRLEARAYGGTLASAGLVGFSGDFVGLQATVSLRDAIAEDIP